MRIISGKFKGHKLVSFDQGHIRPTTDRVKESLFNIIAGQIEDARVLDLFSGTGNLGLEAFSRGARQVDMVEISAKSLQIIRMNLAHLKIEEGVDVIKSDAVKFVRQYEGEPYNVILIDPPFPLKICKEILEKISASFVADKNTEIVIEHSRQEPLPEVIENLRCVDTRTYGDKLLAFYKKGESPNAERPGSKS
jgi:16S rRNA (guanine966-N2)-methyltransferase